MRSRSSWEDRSSTQPKPTSTSDKFISSSTYQLERYVVNLEHYVAMSKLGRNTIAEDAKPVVGLPGLTVDGKTFLPGP